MLPQAHMRAKAEGDLLILRAVGIEAVGRVENILVAVRRDIVQHQPVAFANRLPADLDIFLCAAHEMLLRGRPADRFLDQSRLVGLGSAKDRKSVVSGKSLSVRLNLGGRRILKKKK